MWSFLALTLIAAPTSAPKSAAYCQAEYQNLAFVQRELEAQKLSLSVQKKTLAQREIALLKLKKDLNNPSILVRYKTQAQLYNMQADKLNALLVKYNKSVDVFNSRLNTYSKQCF